MRPTGGRSRSIPDDRAVAPAIGKALEVTVLVLFVGLLTTALYGGVVPEYTATAGEAVADRTLASASHRIRATIPRDAVTVSAQARVPLPETIDGEGYAVRVDGETLVLDHPNPAIDSRSRLALPPAVTSVSGRWSSREPAWVTVHRESSGLAVELVSGGSP